MHTTHETVLPDRHVPSRARDVYGERINSNNITAIIIIKSVTNTIYDNNRAIVVSNRRVHRLTRDDAVIIMMIDDDGGISPLTKQHKRHMLKY